MENKKEEKAGKKEINIGSSPKDNGGAFIINADSIDQFESTVIQSLKPSLIDFWAPWCAPCKMVAPIFEDLARAYHPEINFVKVNTQEHPEIAQLFGIRSIPAMIIMKGENVIDVHIGAAPRDVIERFIKRHISQAGQGGGFGDKIRSLFGLTSDVN